MNTPYLYQGMIVYYVMRDGATIRPAMIVRVVNLESKTCALQIFTDGDRDKDLLGEDEAQDVIWVSDVPFHGPTPRMLEGLDKMPPHTWHRIQP